MRLTRKQAESLGLGDLFPSGKSGGRGGPAHVRFAMNRTEARYAGHLEARRLAGEIGGWEFERDTLILSPDMTLTPDFRVELDDGWVEFHEVKRLHGWTHEDSIVKTKAAAAIFPFHRFYLARWQPDRIMANGTIRPGRWALRRLGVAREKGTSE
jgi:hypothetical protein